MSTYAKVEQKQRKTIQKNAPESKSPNLTGIPDAIKTKFEALSEFSFDDVRIHYNSDKPERLQALAYAQGNQVYIAPGQEKHLEHELGHVVQQKQGVVSPNSVENGLSVNNNPHLEMAADRIMHRPPQTENQQNNFYATGFSQNHAVIQKQDTYIPDGGKEPHIHIHSGGITYTGVGHSHRDLVSGDKIRDSVIREVYSEIILETSDRYTTIAEYLSSKFPEICSSDQESVNLLKIKTALSAMGGLTVGSRYLSVQEDSVELLSKYEDEIMAAYLAYKRYIDSQGESGGIAPVEFKDLKHFNKAIYGY